MSEIATEDGRAAFDVIDAMSRENQTNRVAYYDGSPGPMEDGGGEAALPWYAALFALTDRDMDCDDWDAVPAARRLFRRHTDADEREIRTMELHRRRSFVEAPSDGDRPADLTDEVIAGTIAATLRGRTYYRDESDLRWSLYNREVHSAVGQPMTAMHKRIHRALSGEDYAARYERIRRDGGKITELTATKAQPGPSIKKCPWCKDSER